LALAADPATTSSSLLARAEVGADRAMEDARLHACPGGGCQPPEDVGGQEVIEEEDDNGCEGCSQAVRSRSVL